MWLTTWFGGQSRKSSISVIDVEFPRVSFPLINKDRHATLRCVLRCVVMVVGLLCVSVLVWSAWVNFIGDPRGGWAVASLDSGGQESSSSSSVSLRCESETVRDPDVPTIWLRDGASDDGERRDFGCRTESGVYIRVALVLALA